MYKKILLIVFVLSFSLIFFMTNPYAQAQYQLNFPNYGFPPNNFSLNFSNFQSTQSYPGFNPFATTTNIYPLNNFFMNPITPVVTKSKQTQDSDKTDEPKLAANYVACSHMAQEAELTGDMLLKFDEEDRPNVPINYDYYYLKGEIYPDLLSYIHTPCCPRLCATCVKPECLAIENMDAQSVDAALVPCCYGCNSGEAIFKCKLGSWGIYKIREKVFAKDMAHDSFYVEVKRVRDNRNDSFDIFDDKRIPFAAFWKNESTNEKGIALVKKAHDRFEFSRDVTDVSAWPPHGKWYWKDVCHWNAYVPPKESAHTCFYVLAPGEYEIIYSTRERCTRLAEIKLVRVIPFSRAVKDTELELQDYFEKVLETDPIEPIISELKNIDIEEADEVKGIQSAY